MDKLKTILQKLGIELTADQTKQLEEVISKEFVSAADAAADNTKQHTVRVVVGVLLAEVVLDGII